MISPRHSTSKINTINLLQAMSGKNGDMNRNSWMGTETPLSVSLSEKLMWEHEHYFDINGKASSDD